MFLDPDTSLSMTNPHDSHVYVSIPLTLLITPQTPKISYDTLDQSIDLIENTLVSGESGCIHIPQIKSYKIHDIALYYSKTYNKPITITGIRQNEKIHEELINETEFIKSVVCEHFIKITNHITKECQPLSYNSINTSEIFDEKGEYIFKEYLKNSL